MTANLTASSSVAVDFNKVALNYLNYEKSETARFTSYKPATVRNILNQIVFMLQTSKKYEQDSIMSRD